MSLALAPAEVEAGWRELAAWRTPFQTPAWYEAAGFASRVRLIQAGGDEGECPRALLPAWEVRGPAHYYHAPRTVLFGDNEERLAWDGGRLRDLRAADWGTAVVSVSPFGYRGGALAAPGAPPGVMRALALELVEHARRSGASLLISHFLFEDEDADWIQALVEAGGTPLVLGAHGVLDLSWSSLDEYLDFLHQGYPSLRPRRERGDVDQRWVAHDAPGPGPGQGLLAQALRRRLLGHEPEAAPLSLLEAIVEGRSMPRVLFSVGEAGAPARSGLAALAQGETLYPKFVAADRDHSDYFPLVFARAVEYALAHGYRRIDYGGGSHQAKLMRGCHLRLALGVVSFLDSRLEEAAAPAARRMSRIKLEHFSALSRRWHPQGSQPSIPRAVAEIGAGEDGLGIDRIEGLDGINSAEIT